MRFPALKKPLRQSIWSIRPSTKAASGRNNPSRRHVCRPRSNEVKMQVNVENELDETYWGTAHVDNNVAPGALRSVRVTLTSMF